jgi:hypothetical protein
MVGDVVDRDRFVCRDLKEDAGFLMDASVVAESWSGFVVLLRVGEVEERGAEQSVVSPNVLSPATYSSQG